MRREPVYRADCSSAGGNVVRHPAEPPLRQPISTEAPTCRTGSRSIPDGRYVPPPPERLHAKSARPLGAWPLRRSVALASGEPVECFQVVALRTPPFSATEPLDDTLPLSATGVHKRYCGSRAGDVLHHGVVCSAELVPSGDGSSSGFTQTLFVPGLDGVEDRPAPPHSGETVPRQQRAGKQRLPHPEDHPVHCWREAGVADIEACVTPQAWGQGLLSCPPGRG